MVPPPSQRRQKRPPRFEIVRYPSLSKGKIEGIVNRFLKRYMPDNLKCSQPFDAVYVFETLLRLLGAGYEVWPQERMGEGVEAFTCASRGMVVLSEESAQLLYDGEGRGLFTLAHELFHWIQHIPHLKKMGVPRQLIQIQNFHRAQQLARQVQNVQTWEDPEWQANYGAGCFLIPEPRLIHTLEEYGENVGVLIDIFGVSGQVASKRISKYRDYCKKYNLYYPVR